MWTLVPRCVRLLRPAEWVAFRTHRTPAFVHPVKYATANRASQTPSRTRPRPARPGGRAASPGASRALLVFPWPPP